MAEKTEAWNPTCNRFVAFLDIMGFRDMVLRKSHEEIKCMFEALRPTIDSIKDRAQKRVLGIGISEDAPHISFIFPVSFSDSIILISNDDSKYSAISMLVHIEDILYKAIDAGIPIKGAIAFGEQTADLDRSLYFGKPLIDAFELQNELQLYGVILHHTMEKYLIDADFINAFKNIDIYNWSVTMKAGNIIHYIVDWTTSYYLHNNNGNPLNPVNKLYNNVSGTPRVYVDNTMEFVRWVTAKKKAELEQEKENSKP